MLISDVALFYMPLQNGLACVKGHNFPNAGHSLGVIFTQQPHLMSVSDGLVLLRPIAFTFCLKSFLLSAVMILVTVQSPLLSLGQGLFLS